MLRTMTFRHFLEWLDYYELEPFGEVREDIRNAHIVQTLVNLHHAHLYAMSDGKGFPPEPKSIDKFVLPFGDGSGVPTRRRTQTVADQIAMAKRMAAMQAAIEARKRR